MRESSKLPVFPVILIMIGVLILVGVGMIVIFFRPPDNTAISSESEIPFPEIIRVSLIEAKDAFDTGSAVFIDVRGKSYYEISHIPGAKSIPLNEIEQRLNELDSESRILLYCT